MASNDSNDDELKDKQDSSEDNFGLPDIEYKPLDQGNEVTGKSEEVSSSERTSGNVYSDNRGSVSSSSYEPMADEPRSKAPIVLGIVIVLVIAAAGYLVYNFVYKPRVAAEKARLEQLAKDALLQKQQAEAKRVRKAQEERERNRLDSIANAKPIIGSP